MVTPPPSEFQLKFQRIELYLGGAKPSTLIHSKISALKAACSRGVMTLSAIEAPPGHGRNLIRIVLCGFALHNGGSLRIFALWQKSRTWKQAAYSSFYRLASRAGPSTNVDTDSTKYDTRHDLENRLLRNGRAVRPRSRDDCLRFGQRAFWRVTALSL